jgi:hypothetical protein
MENEKNDFRTEKARRLRKTGHVAKMAFQAATQKAKNRYGNILNVPLEVSNTDQ